MGGAVVGVRCVGEKLLDNKMSVNNVAKHLRKNTTLKDMSKLSRITLVNILRRSRVTYMIFVTKLAFLSLF